MKSTAASLALALTLTTAGHAGTAGWGSPDAGSEYPCCRLVCVETLNLNTATSEQLQLLYRIGPALAARIVEARPFASVEELDRVKGVGPAILSANWLWISVEGGTTLAVKVPKPAPERDGDLRDWNRLPGCPDQSQDIDGCGPVQHHEDGTVSWECREP